jgi:hypothetical protein
MISRLATIQTFNRRANSIYAPLRFESPFSFGFGFSFVFYFYFSRSGGVGYSLA